MIRAAVFDNGVVGLRPCYVDNDRIRYAFLPLDGGTEVDLAGYDLLIVPNGTDQVAVHRLREPIRAFLAQGKTLFCFDGWFTDWVPGNQWVMDNSRKTIDVRYRIGEDRYGFFDGIALDSFVFSNGISGWWACGYIEPAPGAEVLLADTWDRAVMVWDEVSTPGRMLLTASGPLGDSSYATTDDPNSLGDLARFYHQVLDHCFFTDPVNSSSHA
ncbi:MAG: hypothetical protein KDC54_12555 [Lewinella sp.]|nr:hypothetical protein [Lewinella sp.]